MENEVKKPRRLCSEIQLFDLCDKDTCSCRDGRYCMNEDILAKFEAISEEDDRSLEMYLNEEVDDLEEAYDAEEDDALDVDEYGDEETDENY